MKLRADKDVLQLLMLSLGMMALGAGLMHFHFDIGYVLFLGGSILTAGALYTAAKPAEYFIQDERSRRTDEKAGFKAFGITTVLIVIVALLDAMNIWMPSASQLYALFLVGIYAWIVLRWYYNKKGDAE